MDQMIVSHSIGKGKVTKFHVEQTIKKEKDMTFKQLHSTKDGDNVLADYINQKKSNDGLDITKEKYFKLCAVSKNNVERCKQKTTRKQRETKKVSKDKNNSSSKNSQRANKTNVGTSMTPPPSLDSPQVNTFLNAFNNNLFSPPKSPRSKTPKKTQASKSSKKTKKNTRRQSTSTRTTRSTSKGVMTRSRAKKTPNYRV